MKHCALLVSFVAPFRAGGLIWVGFLLAAFAAHGQGPLQGRVRDRLTGQVLAGVRVFIDGSLVQSQSDEKGQFGLSALPAGALYLGCYRKGYRPERVALQALSAGDLEIQLVPSGKPLKSQEPDSLRSVYQKNFERYFLGVSSAAGQCRLLNPQVLRYFDDAQTHERVILADEPLRVENAYLGYTYTYCLDWFTIHSNGRIDHRGMGYFTQTTPANRNQQRDWEAHRQAVYRGSLRHFLRALAANQLSQASFSVFASTGVGLSKPGERMDNPRTLWTPGPHSFRQLRFTHFLRIVYSQEPEQAGESQPQRLNSWLNLGRQPVYFTSQGQLLDPRAVQLYGAWAQEALADCLPLEYELL